jgi:hypothetical protein
MENTDKERIEQLVETRKKAHPFCNRKSRVYQSFVEMEQNTYKNGQLNLITKTVNFNWVNQLGI